MKRMISSLGICLFLLAALLVSKPADAQPRVGINISFQTFYDELSPYGDWIDYPDYGYTWRPRVGSDFRPYATNGHWMYTDGYDWMWNSGYDWGWAPFHYGRWFYDPFYGWMWVPGYEWSPAWVSWRGGGDYYGWAPLRPGISINIGFGSYNPPYDYWTFAPGRYMTSRYISSYYHPWRSNTTIFNNTTIINNYYGGRDSRNSGRQDRVYTNGPRRTDVERYTGRINTYNVRESNRAGRASVDRNTVSVYRPTVQRESSRDTRYSPRQVQTYDRSVARADSRTSDRRSGNVGESVRSTNRGNNESRVTERSNDAATRATSRERVGTAPRSTEGTTRSREVMRQPENTTPAARESRSASEARTRSEAMRQRESVQRSAGTDRSTEMRQRNEQLQQRQAEAQRQRESMQRAQQNRAATEMRQRSEQPTQRRSVVQQPQSQPRVERSQAPQPQQRVVQSAPQRQSSPSVESRGSSSRGSSSRGSSEGSTRGSRRF